MLSIGAVVSTSTEEVDSFYRKIAPLPGAQQYKETMDWWNMNPDIWVEATTDAEEASVVMQDFCKWVNSFGKAPVFVASPLTFDFGFVNWYIEKFADTNPFMDYSDVQRTLDLASFTAGKFNLPLSHSRSVHLPEHLLAGMPEHSHKAIDDARGYGVILRNILRTDV